MLGMVAGVLLSYGIGAFSNSMTNVPVYGSMIAVYFIWLSIKRLSSLIPAVVIAGIAGAFLVQYSGLCKSVSISLEVATPVFIMPQLDLFSLLALGIPLFFMVVGVQNIQAVGVLQSRGYKPPINTIYTVPSVITFLNAIMCAHTAVTAGPSTAIVSSDAAGKKEYRYIAAFFEGIFWVIIGLMGKVGVELTKLFPAQYMQVLVGLALYDVFISTFHGAFGQRFRNGAMAAFFVASTNISLLKVGAPFWAIVAGVVVSLMTEREHFGIVAKGEPETEPVGVVAKQEAN
jgi:benzoate membrane transport protein